MRTRRPAAAWRVRAIVIALAAFAVLVLAACGGSGDGDGTQSGTQGGTATGADANKLRVLAAASLTDVMDQFVKRFERDHPKATVKISYGGSDEAVAQVRSGAPVDAVALADTKLADGLAKSGKADKPVEFGGNSLVVATPPKSPVSTLGDLGTPDVKLVLAAPSVPAGAYARESIGNLDQQYGSDYPKRVLDNVVSNEPDVRDVLAKITTGAADAGFVYKTDAASAKGRVKTIDVPTNAQPTIRYAAQTIPDRPAAGLAKQFVDELTGPKGEKILRAQGFTGP